ncbi:MAG: PKD domain-containing protein [Bacteroidetes bacterium]|nr:PKD domain-containing protein [Bacteroidota bacterium]
MQKIIITLFTLCLATKVTNAQTHRCASTEASEIHFKKHPELKKAFDDYQASFNAQLNSSNTHSASKLLTSTNYTIPMVFHILHLNGVENISDAQVMDAVKVLNVDFAKRNADTSNTLPVFKSIADSVSIRFALAAKDPNGNCTNGIVRYFNSDANWNDASSTLYAQGWDPTKYLNIYVVKTITMSSGFSAAGYTYLPGSWSYGAPQDAIVLLHDYTGTIGTSSAFHSHVLTHEVGHWFNLLHVFGWNSCAVDCNNDDFVNDTPTTPGYLSCPSTYDICTPGIPENYQNFMDYSYCETMFTQEQALRMEAAAQSGIVGRSNLWSASNLMSTGISPTVACPPTALFKSNTQMVCAGQNVYFTDQSNVAVPTNWSWTFEGGTPNVSSVQNPTVTYSSPGTYSVQLIAGNSAGNSIPETKIGYITVLSSPITSNLIESFEGSPIPNSTWIVKNVSLYNTDWQQTNMAAASGSKSAYVSENISPSSVAELFSPIYNFSAMPSVALTYKWAGAERNTTTTSSTDQFGLFYSTNCGLTWIPRLIRNIKSGAVGVNGVVNGNYHPSSSEFYQENVTLAGLTGATSILFKFKFSSETGTSNNFYLDDINLTSVTGLNETYQTLINLSAYPSPASDNVTVSFELLEDKHVEIVLCDVLGRTVKHIAKQQLSAGNQEQFISVSDLSKGIYFVNVIVNDISTTTKIMVD